MVFILIPTHNRSQLLKLCLDSIAKQDFKQFKTIVVNDGSTDETKQVLSRYPSIKVLTGDGNLWWTGAMRLGIDYILSKAQKGDYVLLMNDDTAFNPDFLKTIVDESESLNRAIVTSICFDNQGKSKNLEAGVSIDWTKPRYDKPLKLPANYKKLPPQPVDAACGRGTLVPIEVFQTIGNFSKLLPHYHSDYEFMIRAKRSSFPIYISYRCVVYATADPGGKVTRGFPKDFDEWKKLLWMRRSKINVPAQMTFFMLTVPWKYLPVRFYYLVKDVLYISWNGLVAKY